MMGLDNQHRLNDLRSLAIHAVVADRIRAEPGLLERPRARVREWLETGSTHPHYAQAWAELLNGPLDQLLALLRDEGERAIALRHCSPFAGIVDPRSRWRIWRDVEARWAQGAA